MTGILVEEHPSVRKQNITGSSSCRAIAGGRRVKSGRRSGRQTLVLRLPFSSKLSAHALKRCFLRSNIIPLRPDVKIYLGLASFFPVWPVCGNGVKPCHRKESQPALLSLFATRSSWLQFLVSEIGTSIRGLIKALHTTVSLSKRLLFLSSAALPPLVCVFQPVYLFGQLFTYLFRGSVSWTLSPVT